MCGLMCDPGDPAKVSLRLLLGDQSVRGNQSMAQVDHSLRPLAVVPVRLNGNTIGVSAGEFLSATAVCCSLGQSLRPKGGVCLDIVKPRSAIIARC